MPSDEERIAELEAEVEEQCRLHGMGSEREARLMARVAELEAALVAYASEFDGDVGSIHQNIRAMGAENERLREAIGHVLFAAQPPADMTPQEVCNHLSKLLAAALGPPGDDDAE